ncbi:uncharacterized protein BJ171DRAFT_611515 [Polychytrium aggregatum]|uniref:uncharacterized protein n=1 Tax=Polychytrium aggregatum TaxID=110093 RepID=UPI0022FE6F9C|nr:uncharacterized protein BJ171DRAFT_611515 [Polychytrium aggregatum]KAI9206471.1 hypothetical protein BJ171DRAFT_611515 [Polychytrium aggregatum]
MSHAPVSDCSESLDYASADMALLESDLIALDDPTLFQDPIPTIDTTPQPSESLPLADAGERLTSDSDSQSPDPIHSTEVTLAETRLPDNDSQCIPSTASSLASADAAADMMMTDAKTTVTAHDIGAPMLTYQMPCQPEESNMLDPSLLLELPPGVSAIVVGSFVEPITIGWGTMFKLDLTRYYPETPFKHRERCAIRYNTVFQCFEVAVARMSPPIVIGEFIQQYTSVPYILGDWAILDIDSIKVLYFRPDSPDSSGSSLSSPSFSSPSTLNLGSQMYSIPTASTEHTAVADPDEDTEATDLMEDYLFSPLMLTSPNNLSLLCRCNQTEPGTRGWGLASLGAGPTCSCHHGPKFVPAASSVRAPAVGAFSYDPASLWEGHPSTLAATQSWPPNVAGFAHGGPSANHSFLEYPAALPRIPHQPTSLGLHKPKTVVPLARCQSQSPAATCTTLGTGGIQFKLVTKSLKREPAPPESAMEWQPHPGRAMPLTPDTPKASFSIKCGNPFGGPLPLDPILQRGAQRLGAHEPPLSGHFSSVARPSYQYPQNFQKGSFAVGPQAKKTEADYQRPNLSWAEIIAGTFTSLNRKFLLVSEIYAEIVKTYPYFGALSTNRWKNAVRHVLTVNKDFYRTNENEYKGGYWGYRPLSQPACASSDLQAKKHKNIYIFQPTPGMPHPMTLHFNQSGRE